MQLSVKGPPEMLANFDSSAVYFTERRVSALREEIKENKKHTCVTIIFKRPLLNHLVSNRELKSSVFFQQRSIHSDIVSINIDGRLVATIAHGIVLGPLSIWVCGQSLKITSLVFVIKCYLPLCRQILVDHGQTFNVNKNDLN